MTARIARDEFTNDIAMACEDCGIMGEWLENRDGNRVVVSNMVTTHNSAQHWTNPLEGFKAGAVEYGSTPRDFNGHTPHMVTGQDFTESHQEEGDNKAMKVLSDTLRVKNALIKSLESENDAIRETLGKSRSLVEELKATIQELLETPDPMPLCKNLDGHNYVPLDQMFVFCTRCGHSIHYKTK